MCANSALKTILLRPQWWSSGYTGWKRRVQRVHVLNGRPEAARPVRHIPEPENEPQSDPQRWRRAPWRYVAYTRKNSKVNEQQTLTVGEVSLYGWPVCLTGLDFAHQVILLLIKD